MNVLLFSLFQHFAANGICNKYSFFGIPPWYEYLPNTDFNNHCQVIHFNFLNPQGASGLVLVVLAAIDILLRIVAYVAIVYTIYGGFQYIASQGQPDKTSAAQETIKNGLIGLVIAGIAVAIVAFIGSQLG
ncbi:MAG TPA: hypothetical protein VGS08_01930 [Candidatus Saccharimonadales bacterium]|nr:hypothetical protein [Candidatus Saccharimonadales bacterium]